jgi:hypothetical protein
MLVFRPSYVNYSIAPIPSLQVTYPPIPCLKYRSIQSIQRVAGGGDRVVWRARLGKVILDSVRAL